MMGTKPGVRIIVLREANMLVAFWGAQYQWGAGSFHRVGAWVPALTGSLSRLGWFLCTESKSAS